MQCGPCAFALQSSVSLHLLLYLYLTCDLLKSQQVFGIALKTRVSGLCRARTALPNYYMIWSAHLGDIMTIWRVSRPQETSTSPHRVLRQRSISTFTLSLRKRALDCRSAYHNCSVLTHCRITFAFVYGLAKWCRQISLPS